MRVDTLVPRAVLMLLFAVGLTGCPPGDPSGDGGPGDGGVRDSNADGDAPPSCGSGLTNCSGTCVDVSSSGQHCGRCGVVCTSVCDRGTCLLEADVELSTRRGAVPLNVTAIDRSRVIGGTITSFEIDWGDGAGFGSTLTHQYTVEGVYTVTVRATDSGDHTATAERVIVARPVFQNDFWSTTDRTNNVQISRDPLAVEMTGGDRGGIRSRIGIAPGSGVFYFEARRLARPGPWSIGIGAGNVPLTSNLGENNNAAGADTFGQLTTPSGDLWYEYQQNETYGFVVDYRGSNPTLHIIVNHFGVPTVRLSDTLTQVTTPVYAIMVGERQRIGPMLSVNYGHDLAATPFVYDARQVLTAAGLTGTAQALTLGFGSSRNIVNQSPVLSVPSSVSYAMGQTGVLMFEATDEEDGDLTSSIRFVDRSLIYTSQVVGTGAMMNFTASELGLHPIDVWVTDLDGRTTRATVEVRVTGDLPRPAQMQMVPDALTGAGIELSNGNLSAHFTGFGKYGIRANQPIYGGFWYFEVQRQVPPNNIGAGLVVQNGNLNPYSTLDIPWSISENSGGGTWINLVSQVSFPSSADTYGFAVDYRRDRPTVYIIVAGSIVTEAELSDVTVPLYPMMYGNPVDGPGPDQTIRFVGPFTYDPATILTARGVDMAGFQARWGLN